MLGLNTFQLWRALRKNKKTCRMLGGVFAADRTPKTLKKNRIYIINTDPSRKRGSHWIAIFSGDPCEFFCPLGKTPSSYNKHIRKMAKKLQGPCIMNTKRLQGLNSQTCGHYCLFYAFARAHGIPVKVFVKQFNSTPHQNDILIQNMSRRIFGL